MRKLLIIFVVLVLCGMVVSCRVSKTPKSKASTTDVSSKGETDVQPSGSTDQIAEAEQQPEITGSGDETVIADKPEIVPDFQQSESQEKEEQLSQSEESQQHDSSELDDAVTDNIDIPEDGIQSDTINEGEQQQQEDSSETIPSTAPSEQEAISADSVAQPAQRTGSQQSSEPKIVEFEADVMRPVKISEDSSGYNLLGNVVLYHNGAVITCDSAVRYNDRRMECFKRVVINKGTTFIYGDRADYNGDLNLASVYGPIIKVVDEDAVLYTYNFNFNTLDNIGHFSGGGTLEQKDNLFEAKRGYYYTDTREVVGVDSVELKNPEYQMKSDSASYNLDTEVATFYVKSHIWNDKGEILRAERGKYYHQSAEYRFTRDAYILTETREVWSDSLDYNSRTEDAVLRKDIQIRDEEQNVTAFGDYGRYWGDREEALLTRNPSLMSYDPQEPDTLYMRSDSMYFLTFHIDHVFDTGQGEQEQSVRSFMEEEIIAPASDSGQGVLDADGLNEETQQEDSTEITRIDDRSRLDELELQQLEEGAAVGTARRRVAEAQDSLEQSAPGLTAKELKRQEKAARKQEKRDARQQVKEELKAQLDARHDHDHDHHDHSNDGIRRPSIAPGRGGDNTVSQASPNDHDHDHDHSADITSIGDESTANTTDSDSLAYDKLTPPAVSDSLGIERPVVLDSLGNPVPELLLNEPREEGDTLQRVIKAFNNVRIFREDFQAVCDSLVSFSKDSTAYLHIDPVLWNESNQITSDLIIIFTRNQEIYKAEFRGGDPFMISEVDSTRYNQVKGKYMEAWFRNNDIYKHDVIGNGQTYYYMQEDDTGDFIGFLVAECASITFLIEDKQMDKIIYRDDPVYTIYPMDKIPSAQELLLPGFKWEAQRRPLSKYDIMDRIVRPSERSEMESMEQPLFPLTEKIITHKEWMIRNNVWRERNDKLSPEALEFIRYIENRDAGF